MNVSVIICSYDGDEYIVDQINSIIKQTVSPDEIIILDDNSNDKTYSIVKETYLNNPLIKVYKNEGNLGVIKNFEKALCIAKGNYIFFSDQDDVWKSNKLETILKAFEENDASLVFHDAIIVDKELNTIKNSLLNEVNFKWKNDEVYLFKSILYNNKISGCCMAIKNNLKNKITPFSDNVLHDQWIALLAVQNGGIHWCRDKLVLYRQHDNNVVGIKKESKSIESLINLYNRQFRFSKDLYKISDNTKFVKTIRNNFEFWKTRKKFIEGEVTILKFIKTMIFDLITKNYTFFYNGLKGFFVDFFLIMNRKKFINK